MTISFIKNFVCGWMFRDSVFRWCCECEGKGKRRLDGVGVSACCSSRLNRATIYNQSTFKYIYETLFTFSMRITNLCVHI